MNILRSTIAAAVVFAACPLAAAPVAAAPAIVADAGREVVRVRIAHGDLDLSAAAGRAMMAGRIDRAVRRACTSRLPHLKAMADAARCRSEMMRDADVQIAAIPPRASVEVASRR